MALQHRKFKLTDSRRKWVEKRDTTLLGEPVRLNPAVADRYAAEVSKMIDSMNKDLSSQIEGLFNTATAKNSIQKTAVIAMDASISSIARMLTNKLVNKWTKRFNTFGRDWTKNMMGYVVNQSAKDLNASMNKLSGGLTIKTDQISDNTRDKILAGADQATSLIRTLGPDYGTEVKEAVSRAILDDSQSFKQLKNSIHSMLQDRYKKYKNKAFNVAKDQMRKSYTAVTASRMRDIGVNEYIWRHAGGSQKPRPHHKYVLNGNVYSLDDPPIIDPKTQRRGKPGDDYFCSCYMQPVISFKNK